MNDRARGRYRAVGRSHGDVECSARASDVYCGETSFFLNLWQAELVLTDEREASQTAGFAPPDAVPSIPRACRLIYAISYR